MSLDKETAIHLAGLIDGEGYIGITFKKDTSRALGVQLSPIIQIALGDADSQYLKELYGSLHLGILVPNRKSGLAWKIRSKSQCLKLIGLIEPFVRLPTTKRRLQLLKSILQIWLFGKWMTQERWNQLLPLILELRNLSKKKRLAHRFNDSFIKSLRVQSPYEGLACEGMVLHEAITRS
jgi:hypothetical protein